MSKSINVIFVIIFVFISKYSSSQTENLIGISGSSKWVKKTTILSEDQNINRPAQNFVKSVPANGIKRSSTSIVLGSTGYDLQTNASMPRRILTYPNKKISIVWNGSLDFNQGATYADRGSFYNFFNGTNWNTSPSIRLESKRTGWANLSKISSGEVCIAHVDALTKNTGTGTTWTTTQNVSAFRSLTWPRSATVGDTIYAIFSSSSQDPISGFLAPIYFCKSVDGGANFSQASSLFASSAGYDTSKHVGDIGGDAFAIDAKGSKVAILVMGITEDVILLKSNDYGVTWTKRIIRKFPINKYQGGKTDINGDGLADTVIGNTNSGSVVIDHQGIIHVVFSDLPVKDDNGFGLMVDLVSKSNYINYWNELDTIIKKVNTLVDLNGNGKIDYGRDFTGGSVVRYGYAGLSTHPMLSVGAKGSAFQNDIYLTYTAVKDGDTTVSGLAYRNIYNRFTSNNGQTWSPIVDVSKTTGIENVFPSVDREVAADSIIHLFWQQDFEPGTSVQAQHPAGPSDIVYDKIQIVRSTSLVANFNINSNKQCVSNNNFLFNNTSSLVLGTNSPYDSIVSIHWDFGDSTFSNEQNPTKIYDSAGTYIIKLKLTTLNNLIDSISKNVVIIPDLPSTQIIGAIDFVVDDSVYTYSVDTNVVVNYNWFVESGTILSSQGKNFIKIKWSSQNPIGTLACVRDNGSCYDTARYSVPIITNRVYGDYEYCRMQSDVLIESSIVPDTSYKISWISAIDSSVLKFSLIPNADSVNYIQPNLYKSTWYARIIKKGNSIDTSESSLIKVLYPNVGEIEGPSDSLFTSVQYSYQVDKEDGYNYNWQIKNGVVVSGGNTNKVNIMWYEKGTASLTCVMWRPFMNCTDTATNNFYIGFSGLNSEKQKDFKIYPNPTTDKIFVESSNHKDLFVELFSIDGKKIFSSFVNDEIDLSQFDKGVYILKIDGFIERVVKI